MLISFNASRSSVTPLKKDERDIVAGLRIYELSFKKGLMTRTHFQATDKQDAIEKGKKFCEKYHATFCGVDDFLVDLDEFGKKLDERRGM